MSVIAEIRIPSADFELGRILRVEGLSSIELESLVPVGEATVPLFWVYNSTRDSFVERVQRHPSVSSTSEVDVFEDRTLFTLEWDANQDHVFRGIGEHGGQLLSAVGTPDAWEFELRFPSHDVLSEFTAHCEDAQISLETTRVYNPTSPDVGPWYGLSEPQREALRLAVQRGVLRHPERLYDQGACRRTGDFRSGRDGTAPSCHRSTRHAHIGSLRSRRVNRPSASCTMAYLHRVCPEIRIVWTVSRAETD